MSCCALSLCVCLAAIRWHLRCFHVSMSVWVLVCVRVHPCLIDCLWKHSNDSVSSSWPSPSLLVSVSLTPAFASQSSSALRLPAVLFEVFLLSLLFLLRSHLVWSQWEVPEDCLAQPHCCAWEGKWALPPLYLPLIYRSIAVERVNHIGRLII